MKTTKKITTMQEFIKTSIDEALSQFKKPQPTQEVYFNTLQALQVSIPWCCKWKLRSALLITILERGLAEDTPEVARLSRLAMKEIEKSNWERLLYGEYEC